MLIRQQENDNCRKEYEAVFSDIPASIPFAHIALDRRPDAVNFWLGNSHSVTALHKDPYENIYVQVLGKKHFVLLPPVDMACVGEQVLPAATYAFDQSLSEDTNSGKLVPTLDDPPAETPFATWDPDKPSHRGTDFSHLCKLLKVKLDPGDMLYLPALWYHKVSQSCGDEDVCVAVNYW